jgi:large subunit ribosomal protein L15
MKLHDLKPAPGSRKAKRRVGRGIAAGQGKTAGRGTKGQKARAGGTIPAWFEGGQTPLHQRIPKLRGFKNKFKIEYEVVNVGDIARLVELGELEGGEMPGAKPTKKGTAPITVNQEILRAAGLVRRLDRPMKVLGSGELSTALFVVADAFSASARSKIEGAGGTVSVLEIPTEKRDALGLDDDHEDDHGPGTAPVAEPAESAEASASDETVEAVAEAGPAGAEADQAAGGEPEKKPARAPKARAAKGDAGTEASADAPSEDAGEAKPAKARAPRKPKASGTDADA